MADQERERLRLILADMLGAMAEAEKANREAFTGPLTLGTVEVVLKGLNSRLANRAALLRSQDEPGPSEQEAQSREAPDLVWQSLMGAIERFGLGMMDDPHSAEVNSARGRIRELIAEIREAQPQATKPDAHEFLVWADPDDLADTREGQYATVHGTRRRGGEYEQHRLYRIVPVSGPEEEASE